MPVLHQITAGFTRADAISNIALAMRAIFRSWGCESNIYCETRRILPELRNIEAFDLSEYVGRCKPEDIAILHLSIGSLVNEIFAHLPCRKVIMYHNVTPPEFFEPFQKQIAHSLRRGLEQVRSLAGVAEVTMAVSRFNADELAMMGHKRVKVLPVVIDYDQLRIPASYRILKKYRDGRTNVLFVGRCVPNKKLEDLILAFSVFQKTVAPDSRLIHVGSSAGMERYKFALQSLAKDLHVRNLVLAGSVPQSDLNAFYRVSHLFLSMSAHEGFCIPLIEAMFHEVPVLGFDAGAVSETLSGAGVLFREKNFELVAEMMGRLVRDEELRAAVLVRQKERIQDFSSRELDSELLSCLAPLMSQSS